MEESSRWLDFHESQFRGLARPFALRLMDIEGGLTPEMAERPKVRRYYFPTASLEKNPTWRETINSLRAPRRRERGYWVHGMPDVRCVLVVFEDPGVPPARPASFRCERRSQSRGTCAYASGTPDQSVALLVTLPVTGFCLPRSLPCLPDPDGKARCLPFPTLAGDSAYTAIRPRGCTKT